eukprot:scaffold143174_cov33-Tisochrysis_lutea.AAC.2
MALGATRVRTHPPKYALFCGASCCVSLVSSHRTQHGRQQWHRSHWCISHTRDCARRECAFKSGIPRRSVATCNAEVRDIAALLCRRKGSAVLLRFFPPAGRPPQKIAGHLAAQEGGENRTARGSGTPPSPSTPATQAPR